MLTCRCKQIKIVSPYKGKKQLYKHRTGDNGIHRDYLTEIVCKMIFIASQVL